MVGIIQSKIILQQFPAFKKNWTLSKKVFEKLRPQQVMTMKQHPPLMGRHSSPGQLQSGLQLAQGLTWPKTEHVLCKKTSLLGQHSSFPFPPLMGFLAAAFNWVLFWLLLLWHGPSPFLFEFTGRQATKKHWSVFKVVPTCHRVTPCDTANH